MKRVLSMLLTAVLLFGLCACGRSEPEETADDATIQLRSAAYRVMTGKMTIDEAVAGYGSLE